MSKENDQTQMDMRTALEKEISNITYNAVVEAARQLEAAKKLLGSGTRSYVRNRHEAYGHAAEQLLCIQNAVKRLTKDTADLLVTLSDPNKPALDAVSSICVSAMATATTCVTAAAEMSKVMDDLYIAETAESLLEPTPMEELAAEAEADAEADGDGFEEAPEETAEAAEDG